MLDTQLPKWKHNLVKTETTRLPCSGAFVYLSHSTDNFAHAISKSKPGAHSRFYIAIVRVEMKHYN